MSKTDEPVRPRAYRGPVRRLRVVVTKGEWRVEKEMRVERMTLRPHWDPVGGRGLDAANCVELLDEEGKVLHRQCIKDPLDSSVEMFEKDRIWREHSDREVVLDIMTPDLKRADRLRLVTNGRDLPVREGRRRPHTQGLKLKTLRD